MPLNTKLPFGSKALIARLNAHAERLGQARPRALYDGSASRYDALSFVVGATDESQLLLDCSRQRLDTPALEDLFQLAHEAGMPAAIHRLVSGAEVNATERRAALHMALRDPAQAPLSAAGCDVRPLVATERARLRAYVQGVLSGAIVGATGVAFRDVIQIGIGGSDLGVVMALQALKGYAQQSLRVHCVSNVDAAQLTDLLKDLNPATTLVLVCSKTFTTQETLSNARLARAWLIRALGESAVPQHVAAVSVNQAAMNVFGVGPTARFAMWDWVGGRYSLWSAIGLGLELAIGSAHFEQLLAGAHAMDLHFQSAPLHQNAPVILGLVGVWNRNFMGCAAHAVLPYTDRLNRFPAYLQQLIMESNGKTTRTNGLPVEWDTESVLFGEPGSNAQHSFFQMLHQGTAAVSLDFLLPAVSPVGAQASQQLAISHCLAQAEAFALGFELNDVRVRLSEQGLADAAVEQLAPHKVHPGHRPSTIIAFRELSPRTLGMLIALYEHATFVKSVLWDINPFDQWGVELGKQLADSLAPVVRGEQRLAADSGLQQLVDRLTAWDNNG